MSGGRVTGVCILNLVIAGLFTQFEESSQKKTGQTQLNNNTDLSLAWTEAPCLMRCWII